VKVGSLALRAYVILFFIGLYVPLAVLVILGFNSGSLVYVWEGFTTDKYAAVLTIPRYTSAFGSSIVIALGTTALSVFLGALSGIAAARSTSIRYDLLWTALVLLPLIVPEIVEAFSIVLFYQVAGIRNGTEATIIGHTAFSVSFVALIVRARMGDVGRIYEEASMLLGATRLQTFTRIHLPMAAPAVIAGGFLAFAASFDDVVKSSFTTSATTRTLPLIVFSEAARGGISSTLNALAAVMVAISLSAAIVRVLALRRFSRA